MSYLKLVLQTDFYQNVWNILAFSMNNMLFAVSGEPCNLKLIMDEF